MIRGLPLDGAWILFLDAGRGWLVGPPVGTIRYPAGAFPSLRTSLVDAGIGITFGPFGFYVAQAVTPWAVSRGPRLALRLQQRF